MGLRDDVEERPKGMRAGGVRNTDRSGEERVIPVTVIIPTRNEELNIERTLRSLHGFVKEIFVIDSESEDRTVDIARQYATDVVMLPYEHGRIIPWIFQWGLDHLPISNEWVLILEADQTPDGGLKRELDVLFARPAIDADGFYLRRKQVFRGRWIKHGGYGKKHLLKLFRRGKGELDVLEEDTRVYVQGRVDRLKGFLVEENLKEADILFYLQKHLRYADAFARDEHMRRQQGIQWKLRPRILGTPDERTLWLKTLYYRLPLYVRPWLYFLYRYVIRLGILDGKKGFIFHFLQAFWFRLVVDIRLEELKQSERK
jgi:glycosyltransferase involved in cell wall biosynthesis